MSSRKADEIAIDFKKRLTRLNGTRQRIEQAHSDGHLHLIDVETAYSSLFLQAVVNYETAVEQFCLGLVVRPGGVRSTKPDVRARVTVRSYSHALDLANGPGGRYPAWLGENDLKNVAKLLLHDGLPYARGSGLSWHFIKQCAYIRNAISHPSQHAYGQFKKHVIGETPLPRRETKVAGFLRGRLAASGQTRWETYVAGLASFVTSTIA